ncbi:hypothetical protein Anas_05736 [Armadillidium nasatum]|uniref:Dynein heavy chain linker domain-containing protein n=1 Tax=Armadillidium nasatum TaxID=96803 RepID=A0A5N5TCP5_9CRUS|nr:hypothetical protein Anas_05736 [Armadillidium nasatum]
MNLESQVGNFNGELERFLAKWNHAKPKESILEGDSSQLAAAIATIREKQKEWVILMETRDTLNKSLEEFSSEEWIVFRSKTYRFEEFLNNWASKLQNNGESTPVTVRLLQELQKYKTIIPVLKFVRGDMFSEKHWIEMYNLIGIPSSVPVESLTFGHFIQVKDQILEKSEELKDLNFRASGEVVIRQALAELDTWEVDAKFSLVPHKTTNGNEVGDHQSLLQSLKDSAYYGGFSDRARVWEQRLADLDEYLANLNLIQSLPLEIFLKKVLLNCIVLYHFVLYCIV